MYCPTSCKIAEANPGVELPDKDIIARYQECISYLRSYESKAQVTPVDRTRIEEYIQTAEKAIEKEEKRRERARRRAEEKAKKNAEEGAEPAQDSEMPPVVEEPAHDLGGEPIAPEDGKPPGESFD